MSTLERITHLVATDPTFRQAMELDPQTAIASQGLILNEEEMVTISSLRHLLAASPQALLAHLLSVNEPTYWGGVPPLQARR